MKSGPIKIALYYTVAGICWITLSDRLLFAMEQPFGSEFTMMVGSVKGIGYVLITGLLLYQVIRLHVKKLADSERQYRSYFDDHTNPMFLMDRQTFTFSAVNQAALEHYGYTRSEFMQMSMLDLLNEKEINPYITAVHNLKKGINDLGIWQHRKKDGRNIDSQITAHLIDTGPRLKLMTMATDVTEVQRLALQSKEYLNRLEDTLRSINDAFFTIGKDWKILSINRKFEELTGYSEAAIHGQDLFSVFPKGKGSRFEEHFQEALSTSSTVRFKAFSEELQKWLQLACYPTGQGIAVYFTDVTEQKEKDVRLAQSLERYDLVAKATGDLLYEFDLPGARLQYVQAAGEFSTLGLGTETDATTWLALVHPDDREALVHGHRNALFLKKNSYSAEYRMNCNGTYRYVLEQAKISYDIHGMPDKQFGAVRDIHELRTAYADRRHT